MRIVFWTGPVPEKCELCGRPIQTTFIDGRTLLGSWACMCEDCFYHGAGVGRLGLGNGQQFVKQPDNQWKKVAG